MGKPASSVLELTIASSYENMDAFAALVEQAARQMGVPEDDEVDLMIAVMEAVNNAILHGNAENADKKVHMKIETNASEITIWVQDEGAGFEPDRVPSPLTPQNVLNTSGRGLLMMRAFMDDVKVFPSKQGTLIKMTKRFGRS